MHFSSKILYLNEQNIDKQMWINLIFNFVIQLDLFIVRITILYIIILYYIILYVIYYDKRDNKMRLFFFNLMLLILKYFT